MTDKIAPSTYRKGLGIILKSSRRDAVVTDSDAKLLNITFTSMNVVPAEYDFSTKADLETIGKEIDLTAYEYCIVVILAHGGSNSRIALVNDQYADIRRTFLKPLRKKISAENKFFWIVSAACRGQKTCTEVLHDGYEDKFMLEAFACQHGTKAYSVEHGSLLIKFLCEVIQEHKLDYEVYEIVAETKSRLEQFCRTHRLVESESTALKAEGATNMNIVQYVQVVHTQKRVKFYFNAAKH